MFTFSRILRQKLISTEKFTHNKLKRTLHSTSTNWDEAKEKADSNKTKININKNDSDINRNDSNIIKNDSNVIKNDLNGDIKEAHIESKNSPRESPLKNLLENSATFQDTSPTSPEQQWATTPYPQSAKIRKQGDHFQKTKKDPKDATIILFPGQGSQRVGMAKDLIKFPMARDLFELANYILGYDLLKLCLHGPKAKLDETKHAQPAIMVSSLAALERLKEERPQAIENCVATAGFSLGEITALVFAGALEFERALKLVRIRAESMQLACDVHQGGMSTVIYGPDSKLNYAVKKAKEWALEKGVENPECQIANYLFPHCKVVAGSLEALDYLEKNARMFNLRKVKRLPVSGAFHTNLMAPAVPPFRKALSKSNVSDPVISVYSNVDGMRYRNAEHILQQLPKQVCENYILCREYDFMYFHHTLCFYCNDML